MNVADVAPEVPEAGGEVVVRDDEVSCEATVDDMGRSVVKIKAVCEAAG